MSSEPPRPASPKQPAGQVADILDGVAWDFDAEDDLLSPLVTTERYFRDFPWIGQDED